MIVLPETDLEAAQEVVTRLLSAPLVAVARHLGQTAEVRVTLSYGASIFPENAVNYMQLHSQADTGTKVTEICRQLEVGQATFYAWRKKFRALGVAELRRLKQFEPENHRLKQLVADLSLDREILQEVLRKKP